MLGGNGGDVRVMRVTSILKRTIFKGIIFRGKVFLIINRKGKAAKRRRQVNFEGK